MGAGIGVWDRGRHAIDPMSGLQHILTACRSCFSPSNDVGPGDGIQVIGLGDKYLFLLSHLASPDFPNFLESVNLMAAYFPL